MHTTARQILDLIDPFYKGLFHDGGEPQFRQPRKDEFNELMLGLHNLARGLLLGGAPGE